jgi:hypothetical protein
VNPRRQGSAEPAADEVEAYTNLEVRWREERRLSITATIAGCEDKWHWLVEQVEADYDDTIDDWRNELDSRSIIQRAIDDLPKDLARRLSERVQPWDERFRAATRPVQRSYWTGG